MLLLKVPFSIDFSLSKRGVSFSEYMVYKNGIFTKLQGGT